MTDYTALLKRLTPRGNTAVMAGVAKYLPGAFSTYAINTKLRKAHFLAQSAHESAGFKTLQEYASGAAYEGRKDLGNTQPGDGKRFKGRGIFQLTGRANYVRYGKLLGLDLVGSPEKALLPDVSVNTACTYWNDRKISPLADRDDVRAVTKKINGGRNGLAEREAYLKKVKLLLDDKPDAEVAAELKVEQKKAETARDGNVIAGVGTGGTGGSTAPVALPADPFAFDWYTLAFVGAGVAVAALTVYFLVRAYRNHQRAAAFAEVAKG